MTVTVDIELIEVDGKRLRFKVEARDDKGVIGRGHHERFIIDEAKFMAQLEAKARS
jgi:fluoroacetyl-CoA thioesterase